MCALSRQVSLDGVSGEALDEIVDGAPVASGASTARWTPHSTSTLPAKPAHGKRQPKRRASSIVEKLLAPDLNDRGQPKRPTLLLQLVPVSLAISPCCPWSAFPPPHTPWPQVNPMMRASHLDCPKAYLKETLQNVSFPSRLSEGSTVLLKRNAACLCTLFLKGTTS